MSTRRINTNMTKNMSMNGNPIIKEGISSGNDFLTSDGKSYSRGNILYDRYNGSYHIHKSGHICAGSHNAMVLQSSRFLLELPKNKTRRDSLINSLKALGVIKDG